MALHSNIDFGYEAHMCQIQKHIIKHTFSAKDMSGGKVETLCYKAVVTFPSRTEHNSSNNWSL